MTQTSPGKRLRIGDAIESLLKDGMPAGFTA